MKTFHLFRVVDETGISGTGKVAQGVVFEDGNCALRWLTAHASTGVSFLLLHQMKGPRMTTIRPCRDYVLVKREKRPDRSAAGVFLAPQDDFSDPENPKPRRGTVIAVGPGRWNESSTERLPLHVKVGDVVLYPPVYQGIEQGKRLRSCALGEDELLVLDREIIAVEEG
jgi:chaperonin GroES